MPTILRDHRISSLVFFPIQFNPVTKQLKVFKHIEIIIHGAGSIQSGKDNSSFDSLLKGLVINYENNSTPDYIIDLMIITPNEYEESLLPFKVWKDKTGIRTTIITRDDIEDAGHEWIADPTEEDWVYEGIDAFIKNAYENWGNLSPEFLLFVGETDPETPEMPTHYWTMVNSTSIGEIPTDYYYTTMDLSPFSSSNDTTGILDFPDLFSGRISVDDATELEVILNKIINYEKTPYIYQTEWFNNINLSTFYEYLIDFPNDTSDCDVIENAYFLYTSYQLNQYFSNTNYNTTTVFLNDCPLLNPNAIMCWEWQEYLPPGIPYYYYESDATNAVIESINNGCFLVNHRDHGQSKNRFISYNDGWSHPEFNQNHINLLSNENMLPVMFSLNCQTGWFDGATETQDPQFQTGNFDCFGELLLSADSGGVVGFIGATRNSRSGYNDELCYGLFDAIWEDFDPYNNSIQAPIYKLGSIKDYGLLYMLNKYFLGNTSVPYNFDVFFTEPKYNRRQFEEFHVLGDPTLEIWTGVPQLLYAYVDYEQNLVTIYDDNDQVIPEAKVVLQHGEDYKVLMTDVNGQIYSTLLNNYDVEVSAVKHNYIPWFSHLILGNDTWDADEQVRGNIIVTEGSTLTFEGEINIPKYARIVVMDGGTLAINSESTLDFNNHYCDILAFGNLTIGQNAILTKTGPGQETANIELNNQNIDYSFANVTFNKCKLKGYPKSVSVTSGSVFTFGGMDIEKADILITNSTFTSSDFIARYARNKTSYVYILENCTFFNSNDAVYIDSYLNFKIMNCTIHNCENGLRIFNSGGAKNDKRIADNNIYSNSGTGITIYHSDAKIVMNDIYENGLGIQSLNRSNVYLEGNSGASIPEQTQQIMDNENNEVYATQGSFPYHFKWNAIVDEDNNEPMVYYSSPISEILDVSYNYWGNNFNPEQDLYPWEDYIYEPIWQLAGGGEVGEAEAMYNSAQDKIASEDYAGAKADFQQIVIQYPNTKYAQAAIREMFSIEENAGDDYTALKTYYGNEPEIQNNNDLAKLADYLANFCDIKLENYPAAIVWFEDIIQNPETLEDSIFSIIDLGYTYFLMENGGLKSTYAGSLTEHIPVSRKQFEEKRDYLLTLLFKDTGKSEALEQNLNVLKGGELLQNVPNPFTGKTDIYFKLKETAIVYICIFDYTGKSKKTYNIGKTEKGIHKVEFDSSGLPSGIYFYNLEINGRVSDSKKMAVVR